MAIHRCKNCGGRFTLYAERGIYRCENCGSEYPADPNDPEYAEHLEGKKEEARKAEIAKRRKITLLKLLLLVLAAAVILAACRFGYTAIKQSMDETRALQEQAAEEERRHIEELQQTHIQMPESSYYYRGEDAQSVAAELIDLGFKEVQFIQIDDVPVVDLQHEDGTIERISIDGSSSFSKGDWFSKEAKITITYHAIWHSRAYEPIIDRTGQVQVPHNMKYYSGKNHEQVETELKYAGFTNIESRGLGDVGFAGGITKKNGKVVEVTINGSADYDEGMWFPEDSSIVITYHSRPDKK